MHFLSRSIYKSSLQNLTFSTIKRNVTGWAIIYRDNGDPEKVLEIAEYPVSDDLEPNQILVKMIAAPINPADINMIQGKYAVKPKLPAVGGNEGLGQVLKVGSAVSKLRVGDNVIPVHAGWGTWRTHAICEENNFTQIEKELPMASAATIAVNPCTAYRMLHDFADLKPGDTVIQNGANSGVGQAVIQIAKYKNINTINVIRDRPNVEELKKHLLSLGATYVVIENELRTQYMEEIFKKIPRADLAFNCVGGKSAAELTRHMKHQSTMITYGGMSKLPLTISTASLIFNDIRYRGFWMTQWSKDHPAEERRALLKEIAAIIKAGHLKPPVCREVPFKHYKDGVTKSMEPFVSQKQILVMDQN